MMGPALEDRMMVIQFDDGVTKSLMEIPAGMLAVTSDDLDDLDDATGETSKNPCASFDFVGVRVPCVRYIANDRYTAEDVREWLVSLKSKMKKELPPCWLHVVAQYGSTAYLGMFVKLVNERIQRTYKQFLKTPEGGDSRAVLADVLKVNGEAFQLLLGSHQLVMDPQTKYSLAMIAAAMLLDKRGKPSWFADYMENMSCTKLRWTVVVQLLGERVHHTARELATRDFELAVAKDHKDVLAKDVLFLKDRDATFDAKWDAQRKKLERCKKKLSQALERLTQRDTTHRDQLDQVERRAQQELCKRLDEAASEHNNNTATLTKHLKETEQQVDSLLLDRADSEQRATQAEVDLAALRQKLERSVSRITQLERRVQYYKKRSRGSMRVSLN